MLAQIGQGRCLRWWLVALQEYARAHHDNPLRALAAHNHGKAIIQRITQGEDRGSPPFNPAVSQSGYWQRVGICGDQFKGGKHGLERPLKGCCKAVDDSAT